MQQALKNNEKIQDVRRRYGILNPSLVSYGFNKQQAIYQNTNTKTQIDLLNSCTATDAIMAALAERLPR